MERGRQFAGFGGRDGWFLSGRWRRGRGTVRELGEFGSGLDGWGGGRDIRRGMIRGGGELGGKGVHGSR
jgi:hypothetical protein